MAAKSTRLVGGSAVRQLAQRLREQIRSRCQPGERLPSEAALAREHRRCSQTVRRALAILADEGLIERVHGSGTYVADPLPFGASITALFFYGEPVQLLAAGYFRDVLIGVLDATSGTSQQVQPILGRTRRPVAVTTEYVDRLGLERFNSVVSLEVFNHDLLERLAERRVTVSVDFACHRPGVSSCALDHAQTVNLAMDQLRALGHRRIGFVGRAERGLADPAHAQRLRAYQDYMRLHSPPPPGQWILPATVTEDLVAHAENWHRSDPADRPTALLCIDRAWDLIELFTMLGVRIPADVSVLSIGAHGSWQERLRYKRQAKVGSAVGGRVSLGPPADLLDSRFAPLRPMVINHVSLPFEQMGRWAMGEALRRLDQPTAEPQFKLFAGGLEAGTTVAPPADL